jgi:hypothetical protein
MIFAIFGPLGMASLFWFLVAHGARGGTLRISPEGLYYRVGAEDLRLAWQHLAGVHPIKRSNPGTATALWLPREDAGPPETSGALHKVLRRATDRRPCRLLERPDGILLPIGLFGGAKTVQRIIAAVERHRAAAGPGRAA